MTTLTAPAPPAPPAAEDDEDAITCAACEKPIAGDPPYECADHGPLCDGCNDRNGYRRIGCDRGCWGEW